MALAVEELCKRAIAAANLGPGARAGSYASVSLSYYPDAGWQAHFAPLVDSAATFYVTPGEAVKALIVRMVADLKAPLADKRKTVRDLEDAIQKAELLVPAVNAAVPAAPGAPASPDVVSGAEPGAIVDMEAPDNG